MHAYQQTFMLKCTAVYYTPPPPGGRHPVPGPGHRAHSGDGAEGHDGLGGRAQPRVHQVQQAPEHGAEAVPGEDQVDPEEAAGEPGQVNKGRGKADPPDNPFQDVLLCYDRYL